MADAKKDTRKWDVYKSEYFGDEPKKVGAGLTREDADAYVAEHRACYRGCAYEVRPAES